MRETVYIETTIPSYLTAWPSRDLIRAAHQQLTREFWDFVFDRHDVFVSQAVINECSQGDPSAAQARLHAIQDLPILEESRDALLLAERLIEELSLPQRAEMDALHLAIAAVNGIAYLVTWNCTHMANASLRRRIEATCRDQGFEPPLICTPPELLANTGGSDG